MKNKELEKRSYLCEVRAEEGEKKGIIIGRPVVYGSRTDIGWFDEIIEPGALDMTDLTDVRFLVNHDFNKIPLARSRRNNGNSTMLLTVDAEGLMIRAELDIENNAEAKALYSAVLRGDISGMSFCFFVKDEEWDDLDSDHPLRRIKTIESIVEVSAVTFPAYSATEINARDAVALDRAKLALDNARASRSLVRPLDKGNEDTSLELEKAKFLFKTKL